MLRLFVAVAAPQPVRDRAEEVLRALRGHGDVRWVAPERLHLTLKFLGATPPEKVAPLVELLQKQANTFSSFVIYLGGVGAFPTIRKPRTLWLGVSGQPLARLAAAVDREVHPLGFDLEERPYRAHLTLGRVRSGRGLSDLAQGLQKMVDETSDEDAPVEWPPVPWPVSEFHLLRSDLRPSGPEYTLLERFPLRAEE